MIVKLIQIHVLIMQQVIKYQSMNQENILVVMKKSKF